MVNSIASVFLKCKSSQTRCLSLSLSVCFIVVQTA